LCRLGCKDFSEDSSDCEKSEDGNPVESGCEDENNDENKAEDDDKREDGVEEEHLDEEAALMSAMGLPTAFAAKDTYSKVI
jgi:hypothetical protein